MNVTAILFAALIVGGVGILIGFFLGISGEKFKVEVDEKEVVAVVMPVVPVWQQQSQRARLRSISVRSAARR